MATILPKAGTKWPSTPASFIRRSTVSGSFFDVRMSTNNSLASSFSRNLASISLSERVIGAHGVGMECEIVLLRQIEDPDQVDRIALEDVGLGEANAVLVDDEIIAFGKLAALHRAAAAPSRG